MSYFVVGGLYKNTSFNEFVDDSKKERYGPFESYEDAKKYWEKIKINKKKNIGLIWSGNFFGPKEPSRSIELKKLRKLLNVQNKI